MRAQVVLLDGDRILMARHDRNGHVHWVLPGGSVEEGETPEGAAVRELIEECRLEVSLDRLLFIEPPHDIGWRRTSPRYTYLGRITGGDVQQVVEQDGCLRGAAWMPFESPEFDTATRGTLKLVREALAALELS